MTFYMRQSSIRILRVASSLLLIGSTVLPQDMGRAPQQSIQLTVPAGVPLRLYIVKCFSKKLNAPVEAKLLTPVYALDRTVIPAGTTVLGHVSDLRPVSKWERTRAILNGDLTPLHMAAVDFTTLLLPGGESMPLQTVPTPGLDSLVSMLPANQRKQNVTNMPRNAFAAGKQESKDQVSSGVTTVKSIPYMVRSTNKKEWLYDFVMSKLPYHPQYIRSRTRFDAELTAPLEFGLSTVPISSLALLGTQPAPDTVVHARMLTPLNSKTATQGQKVEAVLEQPLFSGQNLILPTGTRLDGTVVLAKQAGWFHRGGRLRFRFQDIDLPTQLARLTKAVADSESSQSGEEVTRLHTQGLLTATESSESQLKVDKEGGVQANDSNTRFLGTAAALLITRAATDNDPIRNSSGAITGTSSNIGGRTLGGGMGFGLFGTIAAQTSRNVGTALTYYGLAWSIYLTVVARGSEVQFDRNSVVDIGFNSRVEGHTGK